GDLRRVDQSLGRARALLRHFLRAAAARRARVFARVRDAPIPHRRRVHAHPEKRLSRTGDRTPSESSGRSRARRSAERPLTRASLPVVPVVAIVAVVASSLAACSSTTSSGGEPSTASGGSTTASGGSQASSGGTTPSSGGAT